MIIFIFGLISVERLKQNIMSEFRYRPKDDYIQETNWESLYVLTEHWISDLRFYEDDLKFFRNLIDKYFIWINEKEHQLEVEKIRHAVIELSKRASEIQKKTLKHLGNLASIIKEPFSHDSDKFRDEHQVLEDEISDFIKTCRNQRKDVFAVIEHVVDNERLQEIVK